MERFARVRIRLKPTEFSPRAAGAGFPTINGRVPTWMDMEVFVVDDRGEEIPLKSVRRVDMLVGEHSGADPITVILEVYPDAIDVEAVGRIFPSPRSGT